MDIADLPLTIHQGKTFAYAIRWETDPLVYKPITTIANTAPVSLTVTGHGVPASWRIAIASAKGLTELNAESNPPAVREYYEATVVDNDTLEINEINALDFKTHTASTGVIVYRTPVDLTSYTARMSIKDKVGGTELVSLTTENGGIALTPATSRISLAMSDTATAALTWTKAVYDLELVAPGGVVTALAAGKITVTKEVTT